ncbi:MAG: AAA family ATPase [Thermoanaerobaculia bacterium]|nr:AAA family ATPase [Thermoanaerobaculia bacterium]
MSRTVALANQKGGVGKTTTAINLGASLAACETKVLLVDLDPQSNATSGLGFPKDGSRGSIYSVLAGDGDISQIIHNTELSGLDLVSSSVDLVGAELDLAEYEAPQFRLREEIGAVRDRYDFILIDCPPSLSLLTVNGLVAADSVLIPIQCEYFALEGVSQLLETVRRVQSSLNPELEIEGILLTMQDDRMNLSRQVSEEIRDFFGGQVYGTVIPRNVRLGEAPSFGKPVLLYDIKSRGSEAYLQLAREFIARRRSIVGAEAS